MSDIEEIQDYPEDYDYKEEETEFVMGGQMWDQVRVGNVDLDLELVAQGDQPITDPEDRFKLSVKEFATELIRRSSTITRELREKNIENYNFTENDLMTLYNWAKIDFIVLKNPMYYVLGFIQYKTGSKPIDKAWFGDQAIQRVFVWMYSRYWNNVLKN